MRIMNKHGIGRYDNEQLYTVLSSLHYDYDRYISLVGNILDFWDSDSINSVSYFNRLADLLTISHEIARQTHTIEWILTNRGQDIHA